MLSAIPPQHGTPKNKPHFQKKFLSQLNRNFQSEKTTVNLKFYAAFLPECRYCMPALYQAASPCSYHRKVISHSDGHSVFQRTPEKISPHSFGIKVRFAPPVLGNFSVLFSYLELNLQIAPTLRKRKTPNCLLGNTGKEILLI